MIQEFAGAHNGFCRTQLLAVFFSILVVTSIAAPVGAVSGSGVADDGGLAGGIAGLSPNLDGEENLSSTDEGKSTDESDGEEVGDSDPDIDGSDDATSDGEDEPPSNQSEPTATESDDEGDETETQSEEPSTTTATPTSLNGCTVVGEGESIQDAINVSNSGDTICVESGTYNETLHVDDDGLTLTAFENDSPVIIGSSSSTAITIEEANDVTIEEIELRAHQRGVYVDSDHDAQTGLTVDSVHFQDVETGIELWGPEAVSIQHNTFSSPIGSITPDSAITLRGELVDVSITDNTFDEWRNVLNVQSQGSINQPEWDTGFPIELTFAENVIRDSPFRGIPPQPIVLEYGNPDRGDVVIEHNEFYDTDSGSGQPTDIFVEETPNVIIQHNFHKGPSGSAYQIRSSDHAEIRHNVLDFQDNGPISAIQFNSGSAHGVVADNEITGITRSTSASGYGVYLQSSTENVSIQRNQISDVSFGARIAGANHTIEDTVIENTRRINEGDVFYQPGLYVENSETSQFINTSIDGTRVDGALHRFEVQEHSRVFDDVSRLSGIDEPIDRPDSYESAGIYLSFSYFSTTDSWADLEIHYDEAEIDELDPEKLRAMIYNFEFEQWELVPAPNDVMLDEEYVLVGLDRPGTLGVFEVDDAAFAHEEFGLDTQEIIIDEGDSDTIAVSGEVMNLGNEAGEYEIDVLVNDSVVRTDAATLSVGESDTLGFDLEFDTDGTYDVRLESDGLTILEEDVTVEYANADLSVVDGWTQGQSSGGEYVYGTNVSVTGTVANDGNVEGDLVVELLVDDEVIDSDVVTVGPETEVSGAVTFEWPATEAGDFEFALNDYDLGTVTVSEPHAEFTPINATWADDTVEAGTEAVLLTSVENTGYVGDTVTIYLEYYDGTGWEYVAVSNVSVAAGEQKALEIPYAFDDPGEYQGWVYTGYWQDYIEVDGEITVIEAPPSSTITEPTVIDQPGTYVIESDLSSATSGSFLEITADDVVIDGQGHELTSTGEGSHGVVIEGASGVTVENLAVNKWGDAGISVQSSSDVTLNNVRASDTNGYGIHLESVTGSTLESIEAIGNEDTGILLDGGSGNTLDTVTTKDSDGWHGIQLDGSSGNAISNLTTESNDRDGIALRHANLNVFDSITSRDNGQMGVRIADSDDTEVYNAHVEGNSWHGVSLEPNPVGSSNGADRSTFENVTSIENGWAGVSISQSNQNAFEEIVIRDNEGIGLNMLGSSWNSLEDVLVEGNDRGILVGADMITSDGDSNYNSFVDVSVTDNERNSVTLTDSGDFSHPSPSVGNEFDQLTIGNHTAISVDARMVEIGSPENLSETPNGLEFIGQSVEIVPESGGYVDSVTFNYSDAPAWPFDESQLELWRHDGTGWFDESDAQSLEEGNTLSVTPGSGPFGTYSLLLPETIVVTNASLSSESVVEGDAVTVSADVTNTGSAAETVTVPLAVDGGIVDEETVTLEANETESLAFTHTFDDPGEFDVSVSSEAAGTVTVLRAPNFVVYGTDVDEAAIELGEEEVVVSASLINTGDVPGTELIELRVRESGTDSDLRTVSDEPFNVSPGEIEDVELSWDPSTDEQVDLGDDFSAEFDLYLGNLSVDTVAVENRESDIQVIAASASETEVIEGEELYVIGSVYQSGTIAGEEEIELTARNVESNETTTVDTQTTGTIAPNFYHLGAINITFEPDQAGTYELELGDRYAGTVEVEPAESDIQVIAASISEAEIVAGDDLYVVGSLYQSGNVEGPQNISLTAVEQESGNTTNLTTVERTVSPGFYHLGSINETFTLDEGGTYDIYLGDRNAGTLEVEPAYSDIQVIAASASATEVIEGEELYVVGSVYQSGTVAEDEEIELTATNVETNETTTVATDTISVSPNFYHLGAINESFAFDDAGTYELELGERYAGTVEVEPAISDIQVIAASISEAEIVAGDDLYVVGSLYQSGTIDGPQNISLTAVEQESGNTTNLTTVERTVSPGFYHLGSINETFTLDEGGTYDIYLGDRNAGTLEVEPAYSDIQVIAASASATEVIEGEELYVVGSVYQSGTVAEDEEIELTATNVETNETTTVATDTISVSPSFYHLGAINESFAFDDAGTYELELGERYAGTVEVEPAISDIQVIAASPDGYNLTVGEEVNVIGSVYQAGNIEGTQEIELTATHNETGNTTTVGSQNVTVSPGFYHLGALNITFEPDDAGHYDLELGGRDAGSVSVEESLSDIQVIGASVEDVELIEGEETHVIGSVYQAGEDGGTETIELTATHNETGVTEVVGTQDVTLSPGYYHLGAINISFEPDEPGTYDLQLGDRDAGWVEVEEAYSDINVIAASISEAEIVAGDDLYVVGSLYQAGTIAGPQDISLTAVHQESGNTTNLTTVERTVSPGFYHLGSINETFTLDEGGTYDIYLGDRNAGTLEVEPAYSDVQVIAASASATEVIEDEELYVIGSVYQSGTIAGDEEIELTATHLESNETTTVDTQTTGTIGPNFYHLGAINISFTPDEAGTYELELGDRPAGTVEVEPAESDIQVIAASISEAEIVAGEDLYVIGSLYQAGNVAEPQNISLTATNTETDQTTNLTTVERTVSPNVYHLGSINETFTLDEGGTYDIYLGDRNAGTLEVEPAYSDIQVIAASASATEVIEGEELHVIGSVYQSGTIMGEEEIELNATDTETGKTTTIDAQTTGQIGPNVYHLGALNVSFAPGQVGTYELELGDRYAGTVEVSEPIVEPSIVDVDGHSSAIDSDFDERTVTYANDDVTVELDVESDFPIESALVQVTSLETAFSREYDVESTDDGTLTVDLPLDGTDRIGDDGVYELRAIAEDERGTVGIQEWDGLITIDTEDPTMSVSIEDVDRENATIVVESDVPLSGVPTVEVDYDDLSTQSSVPSIELTSQDSTNTTFEGTLPFDESGEYTVEVTGADRAGNEGTDEASVVVNTDLVLENGQLVFEGVNTDITFDVGNVHEDLPDDELFLAASESTVNANLDDSDVGVGFLQTELPGLLDAHLEGAEIDMTIEGQDVPDGVGADDLTLNHFDGDGEWGAVEDAAISPVGEDFSVVADVPGFSTYGVFVNDTQAPELESVWPADGETVSTSDETIEVAFEYDDALSGVNATAVTMDVDGVDVTGEDETYIHSTGATHDLDIEYDEEYTVSVMVVDEAGNEATFETTFTVEEADDSDDSGGSGGSSPTPAPSDPGDDAGDDGVDDGDADDVDDDVADDGPDDDTDAGADDGTDDGGSNDDATDDTAGPSTGSDDADDAAGDDDTIPGFSLTAALLVLVLTLAALGVIGRRRH